MRASPGGQDIKNGLLLFATAISFSQRTDDLYDPYCIVKTRPAETVHLVYQYLLSEGSRAEYYVIWMKGGFIEE